MRGIVQTDVIKFTFKLGRSVLGMKYIAIHTRLHAAQINALCDFVLVSIKGSC